MRASWDNVQAEPPGCREFLQVSQDITVYLVKHFREKAMSDIAYNERHFDLAGFKDGP